MDAETQKAIKALQRRIAHLAELIGTLQDKALQQDKTIQRLKQPLRDPARVQPTL